MGRSKGTQEGPEWPPGPDRPLSGGLPETIVVLDCGASGTRALLIAPVEGRYRFIARSEAAGVPVVRQGGDEAAPCLEDAVRDAVGRLGQAIGRRLLDEQGFLISPETAGGGVDAVVAISNAGLYRRGRQNLGIDPAGSQPASGQAGDGPASRRISESRPGRLQLAGWRPAVSMPGAMALARAIELAARHSGGDAIGLDVGSSQVSVASASAGVRLGCARLAVRADLGLGVALPRWRDVVPVDRLQRWLPMDAEWDEGRHELLAMAEQPSRAETLGPSSCLLQQAAARELARVVAGGIVSAPGRSTTGQLADSPGMEIRPTWVIGGGRVFTQAPNPGQAALALLDALEPVGVCRLALDALGLLAPLGAVDRIHPEAAVQVLEQDALLDLGTLIVAAGQAEDGNPAVSCRVRYCDGHVVEQDVPFGSLQVFPLRGGRRAIVEIRPMSGLDIGTGPGNPLVQEVEGGRLGIIIDARGRPLMLPDDRPLQTARAQRWWQQIGARQAVG